jgi:enolase
MADTKWYVILSDKRPIIDVSDVVDEDDYDHFEEIPHFL